jgi:RNA polymerase sigma-70 factor (ECF subfamily)
MDREQLFRKAYGENGNRIYRICCHYFTNNQDREDAYQEILIRIWENLVGFRGEAKLSTWIYRVAVNTCLSFIRSNKRLKQMVDPEQCHEMQLILWNEESTEGREEGMTRFLIEHLNNLSNADRILMTLYIEGLTTHEISDVIGLSESNVRVRIHRIRERIKKEWEEVNNEEI